jgi:Ca2+/Na+ antiporter
MFKDLSDKELFKEYRKVSSPASIYYMAAAGTVIELLWLYFRISFWIVISICIVYLFIFIISTYKFNNPDYEDELKKEIIRRKENEKI